jgi:hypothetical protein
MSALSRDQILGADDLKRELVEVPEWGGSVWVRTLTGDKRDEFEAIAIASKDDAGLLRSGFRARFASWTVCDEDGELLFSDEDVAELGKKSASALDRVFTRAQKLNHLSDEDVDDLAGKSDGVPSDGSGSD